jgi:ppGpp synthetase/RelA/SpoT-type nucleotidyltranferase
MSTASARRFLDWYADVFPGLQEIARQLEVFLTDRLRDENIFIHAVTARAKSPESVAAKLLLKSYKDPRTDMTDQIGARVIVYHANDVDRAARVVRSVMEVMEEKSSDKRLALDLREFGYRSFHLIGPVAEKLRSTSGIRSLGERTFEVQVRSLLEHAWAEIEHETVYKAGGEMPPTLTRRFAAIAGVLELLEQEFFSLAKARTELITAAVGHIQAGGDATIDVPHLLAALEVFRPGGQSFRVAYQRGAPFPPMIEHRLVLGFKKAKVRTVQKLRQALESAEVKASFRRYANRVGTVPAEVSHLAVAAIVLGKLNSGLLDVYFPELRGDAALHASIW